MRRPALLGVVLLVVLSGCATVAAAPPAPVVVTPVEQATPGTSGAVPDAPAGTVRVAYPDPPAAWWQEDPEDLAAGDLASLWGLPLYRIDPLGRLVPGLAAAADVRLDGDGGMEVEVTLATGTWSDGTAVTAADVVATAATLAAARPAAWGAYVAAEPLDDRRVLLRFDRPFTGWPWLLTSAPGVLPASVLDDGGLDAYRDALPVTGGPFRLVAREPGRSLRFEAHPDSPLGAPATAVLDLAVVPDHDTALGLLRDGEVDVVLGHVALDAHERVGLVPGAEGGAVFGGTRFELAWDPAGRSTRAVRLAAAGTVDPGPFVDGLLRDAGRRPGGTHPALAPLTFPASSGGATGDVTLQLARTVEGLGLLGRLVQADLSGVGVTTRLLRVDPPQHVTRPLDSDGRLRVVRVAPGRSHAALLADAGLDPGAGLAADAAGLPGVDPTTSALDPSAPFAAVAGLLVEDPMVVPLAEVAVAHVWAPDRVTGIEPSGWPGLAFWDVVSWRAPAG